MLAGVLLERFLWIPILPRVSGFHMFRHTPDCLVSLLNQTYSNPERI